MTREERLVLLINAVGADIKTLTTTRGDLSTLTTAEKTSIVGAINELQAEITAASGAAEINDDALSSSTTQTYSASKITALLQTLKDTLLGPDVAANLDTIKELATELLTQDAALDNFLIALGNRVRFDAPQSPALTGPQQTQARTNIGAASAAALSALETGVGNTDRDFLAVYTAAKA